MHAEASNGGTVAPVAIRNGFMFRVFIALVVLVLISVSISVAGKWLGNSIALAGHSENRTSHEVVIGNDVLIVPANMIRFDGSRRDGVAARLDLYLRWPDMEGYTGETRDDFNHVDGSRNIIFVSFEERMMSRDMSGRYQPIYSSLIEGSGRKGPGGLSVHSFREESGYMDEVLVVADQGTAEPFVARCLSGEQARQSLAPCERDIHVGEGLTLTYRMPAELAGSWHEVEMAVRKAASGFLQTAR